MKASEFIDAVLVGIQQHGVTAWDVDYRSNNHPRISFAWNDGIITHTVPSSTSNQSGILNNLTLLRQRMGVKRIVISKAAAPAKKSPPKRRQKATTLPELSSMARADPWASLTTVRESIGSAMTEARTLGRAAYHGGLCGVPPAGYPPHLGKMFLAGWRDGEWDTYA